MSGGEVRLRTPFVIQNFSSLDNFIMTVFPDLESYLKEQLVGGIQKSALVGVAYSKLKDSFKLFIERNYSNEFDDYLSKETGHLDKNAMKNVLLSTISITLNVTDENGNKLIDSNYLNALRNILDQIK
ncbi:MAG TPA: hypothetical protein VD815_10010 [Candidatus Saccharimonadales bacterium]|nr:hypothetical protein [Candidatus Saccharimonadales bacterium]